jgi:hypothetical protein
MINFPGSFFDNLLEKVGDKVTVTYLTPQQDENGNVVLDERGHKQYDSQDVTLTARVTISNNSERIINNTDMQGSDGFAKFKLTDAQYLDENSTLTTNYGGILYTFQMLKPIAKRTHIRCLLKLRSFGSDG